MASASLVADVAFARGDDFSLEVALDCGAGVTSLVGRSGAGKSTLLALLAGLERPSRGRIAIGDRVWFDAAARIDVPVHRRRVALVSQGLALFPHMTARDNVAYAMADVAAPERARRATALLERMQVAQLADRKPRTFSGGEAQRVALARALARAPELVLLDEPFSALDPDLRTQLVATVRDLARDLAVPILHVTHSHDEARAIGERAVRIEAGRVVAAGPIADMLP